jgi:purine-binding chemotaxis protein CheW
MSGFAEAEGLLSVCSFSAGGRLYGVDARQIREVVGSAEVYRVPLAPPFIGGVIAYRGEVLTGSAARQGGPVLVLDGDEDEPLFGVRVDGVHGVVTLTGDARVAIPATLDECGREIFCGAFRTAAGLLGQLDPERLRPSRLAARGWPGKRSARDGGMRCGF